MKKRLISTLIAAISVAALSATAVLAAQPNDHGAAVSAVAKAHDALTGRAHGAAVSALAKTHGAEVSKAAKAKAEDFVDLRFVNNLKQSGFIENLYGRTRMSRN